MRLDATDPLSLTAQALYDFLGGDYSTAKDRLTRALEIAPDCGPVRDYYSIAALFAGDFETALDVTDPAGFRHDCLTSAPMGQFAHSGASGRSFRRHPATCGASS